MSRPQRLELRPLFLAGSVLALALAPACKKDGKESNDPELVDGADDGAQEGGEETGPEAPSYPEQDADPPELAQAFELFVMGKYEDAAAMARPLSESLLEDSQIRARGIASAIYAMSAAQDLAEHGHAPGELAVEQAGRLADPELTQFANMGLAAYHLGVQDYVKAEGLLASVVDTESPQQTMARLLHAESVLGQAFEDDKLTHPEKLDAAAEMYESIHEASSEGIYKGRAADGLAAIGYYKKDKDMTCKWAADASTLYADAGASDYLQEGPKGPAEALRCGEG